MKLLLFLILICLPCFASAQTDVQHQKDSLRTAIAQSEGEDKLMAYRFLTNIYYPESANDDLKLDTLLALYKEMLEEGKRQGKFNFQGTAMINTLGVFINRKNYDEVIKRAPEYLDYLAKNEVWKSYYQIYRMVLRAYHSNGNSPKALAEAQRLYEEAKEQGHTDGIILTLFELSRFYADQGRYDQEEAYIKQCLEHLKGYDAMAHIAADAHYRYAQCMMLQKRYDETLLELVEFEKACVRYEEVSKSRQLTAWLNLWRIYALVYQETGVYDKAELYCDKIEQVNTSKDVLFTVYVLKARMYLARKQYEKGLEIADNGLALLDERLPETNTMRNIKIDLLSEMGRSKEANELFKVATAFNDSIRNLEVNRQLDELRTIYEVDKIEAEAKIKEVQYRNRLTLILTVAILSLLALAVIGYFYRKKQVAYRELVRKGQQWAEIVPPGDICVNPEEDGAVPPDEIPGHEPDLSDVAVMEHVEQLMKEKKLYTHTELTLDTLSDTIGISRYYLSKAVNRCSGKSFTTYVNEYRIKEAIRLMSDKKTNHLTIDGIAYDAGFADRANFYRVFKKMTGLSPSTFRSNLQAS